MNPFAIVLLPVLLILFAIAAAIELIELVAMAFAWASSKTCAFLNSCGEFVGKVTSILMDVVDS